MENLKEEFLKAERVAVLFGMLIGGMIGFALGMMI